MKKIIVIYFLLLNAPILFAGDNKKFDPSSTMTPPTHIAHWGNLIAHLQHRDQVPDTELKLPTRKGPSIIHEEKDLKNKTHEKK